MKKGNMSDEEVNEILTKILKDNDRLIEKYNRESRKKLIYATIFSLLFFGLMLYLSF